MALHSTVLIALVLLFGATVPCFAEEVPANLHLHCQNF